MCDARLTCPLCSAEVTDVDEVSCFETVVVTGVKANRVYACKCGARIHVDAENSLEVHIPPGEYTLETPVHLASNVTLTGVGVDFRLRSG